MASGTNLRRFAQPRTAAWHFQQRQRRRNLSMGYEGWPIRVEQIANRDHLFHCWRQLASEGGKGPGIDGYTYADFSPSEVGVIVGDLSEQALSGKCWPEPVRPVQIPKRPGSSEYRGLGIPTLCDRVLGKALDKDFKGLLNKRFSPG
jgi:hypothetical protein